MSVDLQLGLTQKRTHGDIVSLSSEPEMSVTESSLFHWPGHQYAGPGTDIGHRIDRQIKPIDRDDQVAFIHDVDYAIAHNYKDIIAADDRFIKQVTLPPLGMVPTNDLHATVFKEVMQGKQFLNRIADYLGITPTSEHLDAKNYQKLIDKIVADDPNFKYLQKPTKAEIEVKQATTTNTPQLVTLNPYFNPRKDPNLNVGLSVLPNKGI